MSIRAVYGSIGVVCVIGLAMAGVGWHSERRAAPQVPERVFVDIDALMADHPAWDQLVQLRALRSSRRLDDQSGPAEASAVPALPMDPRPAVSSEPRSVLRKRLEQRAEQELSKIRQELYTSLDRRLDERQRELEAQAQAAEAEDAKRLEQKVAEDLHALNEGRQLERVDAAIKLLALKAQLSVAGVDAERVNAAVAAREGFLSDLQARLARDEDDLRRNAALHLERVRDEHRRAIREEIDAVRLRESQRIEASILSRRRRLGRDLDGSGLAALGSGPAAASMMAVVGAGAGGRAANIRSAANSKFASAAAAPTDSLAGFEQALRDRMRSELGAVVRRIGRDNGLQVAFERSKGVRDRTNWFRKHLPYVAGRGAS